jgi:hypothetical protein
VVNDEPVDWKRELAKYYREPATPASPEEIPADEIAGEATGPSSAVITEAEPIEGSSSSSSTQGSEVSRHDGSNTDASHSSDGSESARPDGSTGNSAPNLGLQEMHPDEIHEAVVELSEGIPADRAETHAEDHFPEHSSDAGAASSPNLISEFDSLYDEHRTSF